MKYLLGCVAVGLTVCATVAYSQSGQGGATDPFNGTWKINPEKSKQFTGQVLQPPSYEIITIKIGSDNVQHYSVTIQMPGSSERTTTTYDAKYNDGQWHAFGKDQVMIVKTDARTQYRISRNAAGQSTGVMMRRMAEDGKSYFATHMDTEGRLSYLRWFDRQ